MNNRNLMLLTLSQIFGFTAAPITVFLSGIIGSNLVDLKIFSTLPTSLSIVGMAISTLIAAKIMKRFGRKFGFILGSFVNSFSALLAAYSIFINSFVFYSISNLCIGFGLAFVAQYRFAAAESVTKERIPSAISIILIAGIFSALLGPTIANYTSNLIKEHLYVGSYLALSFLTIIPVMFLSFYKNEKKIIEKNLFTERGYFELIKEPKIFQAIVAATVAYVVMTFLMTATPLSMHIYDNISLTKAGIVIQWHVISMFLPSLFTGRLVQKFGHSKIMYMGIIFFFICIFINFIGQTFLNYLFSLIFLGIGWNFLNIAGTSLLVISYKSNEKYKVQGFNDFIVFTAQASSSILAGYFIYSSSWKLMNFMCIPLLFIVIFIILKTDKK